MAKKRATSASSKQAIDFSIFDGKAAKIVASISLDGSIDTQKEQQEAAMRWRYKMRQRQRWSTNEELARKMEADATKQLEQLGISDEHLKLLAGTGRVQEEPADFVSSLIEVAIPWRSENKDWWARIMPWEFIISAATKKYRARRKRVVVRRLVVNEVKTSGSTRTAAPKSFAILRAAPGKIGNEFDFGE